ncbi:WD-40 repeat-containing protein, partial [Reticulomyxa filosa]
NQIIISSSKDGRISLWNVKTGEILKQLTGHLYDVLRAKFSPNCQFIVSCSSDKTIRIWNIQSGKQTQILKGHRGIITDVKYFPEGQTILSCSNDETICLWDIKSRQKIQEIKGCFRSILGIDISSNGNTIKKTKQIYCVFRFYFMLMKALIHITLRVHFFEKFWCISSHYLNFFLFLFLFFINSFFQIDKLNLRNKSNNKISFQGLQKNKNQTSPEMNTVIDKKENKNTTIW